MTQPATAPTMRERIARAICEADGKEWRTGTYQPGPGLMPVPADPLNNHWRHKADAALSLFATFLRERSTRLQARALDVELTIAEMLAAAEGERAK